MKRTRGYIIAVHVICWLIFLSLPALFIAGLSGNTGMLSLLKSPAWLYFTLFIFIFYLHTNILLPTFYFKKKYFLYFLSISLLGISVFYLRPFDRLLHMERSMGKSPLSGKNFELLMAEKPGLKQGISEKSARELILEYENLERSEHQKREPGKMRPKLDIVSIVLFFLIIALGITIVVIKRWRIAVEQATIAQAEKLNAELTVLKAQVNPHFLFNTLNNIYSMALMHDEKTPESIMKLSNIMRYVTDDATENFVSLSSEANFISDYIELQRLRLGSKVTLDFTINGNLANKSIGPLLLITFIENVFKYGISNNEPTTITIDLRAYNESIGFFCRNKLFPLKHKLESTGIGIRNTRKRLEHLYPGKHTLTIKKEDGFFPFI